MTRNFKELREKLEAGMKTKIDQTLDDILEAFENFQGHTPTRHISSQYKDMEAFKKAVWLMLRDLTTLK